MPHRRTSGEASSKEAKRKKTGLKSPPLLLSEKKKNTTTRPSNNSNSSSSSTNSETLEKSDLSNKSSSLHRSNSSRSSEPINKKKSNESSAIKKSTTTTTRSTNETKSTTNDDEAKTSDKKENISDLSVRVKNEPAINDNESNEVSGSSSLLTSVKHLELVINTDSKPSAAQSNESATATTAATMAAKSSTNINVILQQQQSNDSGISSISSTTSSSLTTKMDVDVCEPKESGEERQLKRKLRSSKNDELNTSDTQQQSSESSTHENGSAATSPSLKRLRKHSKLDAVGVEERTLLCPVSYETSRREPDNEEEDEQEELFIGHKDTFEDLLFRQFEFGHRFMSRSLSKSSSSLLDVASMIKLIDGCKSENDRLRIKLKMLEQKFEHLLNVNSRLASVTIESSKEDKSKEIEAAAIQTAVKPAPFQQNVHHQQQQQQLPPPPPLPPPSQPQPATATPAPAASIAPVAGQNTLNQMQFQYLNSLNSATATTTPVKQQSTNSLTLPSTSPISPGLSPNNSSTYLNSLSFLAQRSSGQQANQTLLNSLLNAVAPNASANAVLSNLMQPTKANLMTNGDYLQQQHQQHHQLTQSATPNSMSKLFVNQQQQQQQHHQNNHNQQQHQSNGAKTSSGANGSSQTNQQQQQQQQQQQMSSYQQFLNYYLQAASSSAAVNANNHNQIQALATSILESSASSINIPKLISNNSIPIDNQLATKSTSHN